MRPSLNESLNYLNSTCTNRSRFFLAVSSPIFMLWSNDSSPFSLVFFDLIEVVWAIFSLGERVLLFSCGVLLMSTLNPIEYKKVTQSPFFFLISSRTNNLMRPRWKLLCSTHLTFPKPCLTSFPRFYKNKNANWGFSYQWNA